MSGISSLIAGDIVHSGHSRDGYEYGLCIFSAAGLDVDDYVVLIPEDMHRLTAGDGIHTKKGGDWNKVWDKWINDNPDATKDEIIAQMQKMIVEFSTE